MNAKEHYEKHLGNFYSWMAGDFESKQKEQQQFFEVHNILPTSSRVAIDLGAGHGIQSVSLAKLGFSVTAIDFNKQLLGELKTNCKGFPVTIIEDDIRSIAKYKHKNPELIACCGDTLTHLSSFGEIEKLLEDCCEVLPGKGKLVLSFRDYTDALTGSNRFIPVKSDANRILTCILEYSPIQVTVTDLLYELTETGWQQKVSSYTKVRVSVQEVLEILTDNGMTLVFNEPLNGLTTVIAMK